MEEKMSRPGIESDGRLAEGGTTGQPTKSDVQFTEVSSCLTFTVFYEDGSVSAGHIGMFAEKSYQDPDEVVKKLQTERGKKEIHSIVVVGETGLWEQSAGKIHTTSTYNTAKKIIKALNPDGKPVTQVDTDDLVGGKGGASIQVSPQNGNIVVKNAKGETVSTINK